MHVLARSQFPTLVTRKVIRARVSLLPSMTDGLVIPRAGTQGPVHSVISWLLHKDTYILFRPHSPFSETVSTSNILTCGLHKELRQLRTLIPEE